MKTSCVITSFLSSFLLSMIKPSPYSGPDKTARYESIPYVFVLLLGVHTEFLSSFSFSNKAKERKCDRDSSLFVLTRLWD